MFISCGEVGTLKAKSKKIKFGNHVFFLLQAAINELEKWILKMSQKLMKTTADNDNRILKMYNLILSNSKLPCYKQSLQYCCATSAAFLNTFIITKFIKNYDLQNQTVTLLYSLKFILICCVDAFL